MKFYRNVERGFLESYEAKNVNKKIESDLQLSYFRCLMYGNLERKRKKKQ